ncbi:MAG: polyribonucleotide nucleotidyltransferase [Chloroflexi bacterium]|nr:polyribonucleotide nucleotidyltransferase [Chloroflexota bacterium]
MVEPFSLDIGGRPLIIEIGRLAEQAAGAALVRYGDSVVLATVCMAQPRQGIDFFPLTVDFEERLYAAGKIPGSFFRREGRPTTEAILTDRITDRSIRPLFPKGFHNEVQTVVTVLSADQENPLEVLCIIGASAALSISEIPFHGPVGATRIGYLNGQLVVNPSFAEIQEGGLDLVVAGTSDAVIMVEAGANEVSEQLLLEALRLGQEVNTKVVELQEEIVRKLGKPKLTFLPSPEPGAEIEAQMASLSQGKVEALYDRGDDKGERNVALDKLLEEATQRLGDSFEPIQVQAAFNKLVKRVMRANVLGKGRRPDGRTPDEIRPISGEVGFLPRTHGSGLFRRGQTQVLTIATLGSLGEMQKLDTLSPEETKRFMHHYNFPPYSTGEVRRLTGAGRREIGHGALAERALLPVIPSEAEFPYTIRLVSEVLSSNGSTSMASVCGSTLALMDAGVPIKRPVAGVAMGLLLGEDGRDFAVLTDIQGIEDFQGDMDFKVAGTSEGITALQLDVKGKGVGFELVSKSLQQARAALRFILGKMQQTIAAPKAALSPYAPRMLKLTVPVDKIGVIIGPGGRTIRSIIQENKVTIDVENDGTVTIGSSSEEAAQRALSAIQGLIKEVEVGEIYTGKVTRIMNFGAFVEIIPGKEGMVHISQLADHHVERVEDEVQVGDEITVTVIEVDRLGRINLSRRAVYEEGSPGPGQQGPAASSQQRPGGDGRRFDNGPRDRRQDGEGFRQRSPGSHQGPGQRRGPGGGRGPRPDFPPRGPRSFS